MSKNLTPGGARLDNNQKMRHLLSINNNKRAGYMTAVHSRDVTPRAVTGQLSNRSNLPTNVSLASRQGAGTRYSSLAEIKQGDSLHARNEDLIKHCMKYRYTTKPVELDIVHKSKNRAIDVTKFKPSKCIAKN